MTLEETAAELSRRLTRLFPRDAEHVLFYEYFDGDTGQGLGASHQTGWTGLAALLTTGDSSRRAAPLPPA